MLFIAAPDGTGLSQKSPPQDHDFNRPVRAASDKAPQSGGPPRRLKARFNYRVFLSSVFKASSCGPFPFWSVAAEPAVCAAVHSSSQGEDDGCADQGGGHRQRLVRHRRN